MSGMRVLITTDTSAEAGFGNALLLHTPTPTPPKKKAARGEVMGNDGAAEMSAPRGCGVPPGRSVIAQTAEAVHAANNQGTVRSVQYSQC